MKTLPIDVTNEGIRDLVVEWSELMAENRFEEAYSLLVFDNSEWDWTPQLLSDTIKGYGIPGLNEVTKSGMLEDWGVEEFEITSVNQSADREEIISRIEVDRENLKSLDPELYLGYVH